MKITLIIEKKDGLLWGRIENAGHFFPVATGETTAAVLSELKALILDYKAHEGANDKFWQRVDPEEMKFDIRYDLQAFFQEHNYLNISAIAERAGLNTALVRHYASGIKHPSAARARKIEDTIHEIAGELKNIHLYPV